MATKTTKKACSFCGAPVTNKAMSVCYSCSTPYSFGDDAELAPREVRFNAVEEHARFREVVAQKPSIAYPLLLVCRPLLLAVVLLVAGRFVRVALGGPDASTLATVFGWILSLPLFLVGVGLLIYGLLEVFRLYTAAWVIRSALVTRKRTPQEGGNIKEAEGRPLVVHVEFRTENKAEALASASLARTLNVNDMGVAFIKGRFLLDYQKLT